LETVIKSKIPGIQSLISKTINEIETELTRLGKPVAADAGVSLLLFSSHFKFSVPKPLVTLSFPPDFRHLCVFIRAFIPHNIHLF